MHQKSLKQSQQCCSKFQSECSPKQTRTCPPPNHAPHAHWQCRYTTSIPTLLTTTNFNDKPKFLSPVSNSISSDMKKKTVFFHSGLAFQEISKRPLQLLQTQYISTNFAKRRRHECISVKTKQKSKAKASSSRPFFKRKLHWQWRRESSYEIQCCCKNETAITAPNRPRCVPHKTNGKACTAAERCVNAQHRAHRFHISPSHTMQNEQSNETIC